MYVVGILKNARILSKKSSRILNKILYSGILPDLYAGSCRILYDLRGPLHVHVGCSTTSRDNVLQKKSFQAKSMILFHLHFPPKQYLNNLKSTSYTQKCTFQKCKSTAAKCYLSNRKRFPCLHSLI